MTAREKKRKAAMIAVAYYLEQEAAKNNEVKAVNSWKAIGKEVIMSNRAMVQRRGRLLRSRA
ncbi:hypothetical protein J1N10_13505 [Carboxylicivirga sp. A043]|uniref:hypothetical protein n=1 Tax=Carboxylicivirga litoralis TaxID=2816963 RepID=UPI0021CB42D4|nr:hypothetical protein [Carboxylicivirga sp. A043]MCU4157000.1 hypothetical protein [Carboxylicivirga sp. A043]